MVDEEDENAGALQPSVDSLQEPPTSGLSVKLNKLMQKVTIEPMLFIKMLAEGNVRIVAISLQIDRVCNVNLAYPSEDCLALDDGNHTDIQTAVQKYQNTFSYYIHLIDGILPLLIVLYAGSLSDRYGRKLPMGCVLAGFIAYALASIVVVLNPSWPVEALCAATIAVDITGSWVVFNMAAYGYMADITSAKSRTKRMGWMDAVWSLGAPIGNLMGGWLHQTYGYVVVFSVSGVLWVFCLLYIVLFVKESVVGVPSTTRTGSCNQLRDQSRAVFKPYPFNGRFHLLSLVALRLGVFLCQGHQLFLWARRVLGWGTMEFSSWCAINDVIVQIGMIVWVWLASSSHVMDHTVAAVGLISNAAWSFLLALVSSPQYWWLVIPATLLGSLKASIEPALRCLITTIPDKNDIGKILAFLGFLESIWLLVDRSIYTFLYNTFVQSFPQINLVVQSVITLLLILLLILLRRDWVKRRQVSNETDPGPALNAELSAQLTLPETYITNDN